MSNKGWECSKCSKSYAPHVDECESCNEVVAIPFVQQGPYLFQPYPWPYWQTPYITWGSGTVDISGWADSTTTTKWTGSEVVGSTIIISSSETPGGSTDPGVQVDHDPDLPECGCTGVQGPCPK